MPCLSLSFQNLLEEGREVYENFFKMYPYCYGYWKKYADLEKKNGNTEMAENVRSCSICVYLCPCVHICSMCVCVQGCQESNL